MRIFKICYTTLAMTALSMPAIAEDDGMIPPANRLRGLKKTNGQSGSGGSVANDGLKEVHPCVPWEQVSDYQKTSTNGDSECTTNSCSNGCCRAYHWLLCDTTNSFPTLQCVCNGLTQNPANFTRYTSAPVSVPAATVTSGVGSAPGAAPGGNQKNGKM
jgi:hypothetical protein